MPWLPPKSRPPEPRKRKPRGKTTDRGYGWEHQQLRIQVMAEQGGACGWCKDWTCETLHHIDHNTSNTARTNLVMLCRDCHQKYHAQH